MSVEIVYLLGVSESKGGMTLGVISCTGCRRSGRSVARPATAPGAACTIAIVIALSALLFASNRVGAQVLLNPETPYHFLRYDNVPSDQNSSYWPTDSWAPVKFIPLDIVPGSYINIGGEDRERVEHYSNPFFALTPRQPPGQPHQLDIALRFPFEPPARLHTVEIAVEVDLQQRRGMIGRATRHLRHNSIKAQHRQIQFINEGIDDADRVIFPDAVVQAIRQQDELAPVLALNKTLHSGPPEPPRRVPDLAFSHRLGRPCPSSEFLGQRAG